MVVLGGDAMSFDIPTPFDDWEEPFYSFIEIDGDRLFLALDENAFIWADATDAKAEEIIVDLIVNVGVTKEKNVLAMVNVSVDAKKILRKNVVVRRIAKRYFKKISFFL